MSTSLLSLFPRALSACLAAMLLGATRADAQAPTLRIRNTTSVRILVFIVEPERWVRIARIPPRDSGSFVIPGYAPHRCGALVAMPSPETPAAADSSVPERMTRAARTTDLSYSLIVASTWQFEDGLLTGTLPDSIVPPRPGAAPPSCASRAP